MFRPEKRTAGLRAGYSLEAPTVQQENSCYCPFPGSLVKSPTPRICLEQIRTWPALIGVATSGSVPEDFRPASGSPTAQQASGGCKAHFVDWRLSRPANVPHISILRALKPFPQPGVSPFSRLKRRQRASWPGRGVRADLLQLHASA